MDITAPIQPPERKRRRRRGFRSAATADHGVPKAPDRTVQGEPSRREQHHRRLRLGCWGVSSAGSELNVRWVISGNDVRPASCPFFPSKQTFVSAEHVCFVPRAVLMFPPAPDEAGNRDERKWSGSTYSPVWSPVAGWPVGVSPPVVGLLRGVVQMAANAWSITASVLGSYTSS
jgi:hypothetical protein